MSRRLMTGSLPLPTVADQWWLWVSWRTYNSMLDVDVPLTCLACGDRVEAWRAHDPAGQTALRTWCPRCQRGQITVRAATKWVLAATLDDDPELGDRVPRG